MTWRRSRTPPAALRWIAALRSWGAGEIGEPMTQPSENRFHDESRTMNALLDAMKLCPPSVSCR
jgi:hypothetical protein